MSIPSIKPVVLAICFAGTAIALPTPWLFLEEGHVDLNWNYIAGEWTGVLLDDEVFPPAEREPSKTLLVVKDLSYEDGLGSRATRPDGAKWDFLGVGPEEDFWVLPRQNFGEPILDLGLAAYDTTLGDIASPIEIALTGFEFIGQGEGHMSVYIYTFFTDEMNVEIATFPGFAAPNLMIVNPGGHRHMNWAFSAKGIYRATFVASGLTVAGDESSRVSSDPVTFNFGVGLSPFEMWLLKNHVSFDGFGEAASPAGDGVPNLLKYALGLPPLVPVVGSWLEPSFVEDGGEEFLVLDLALNPQAQGIDVRVETSSDLADWQSGSGHTVTLEQTAERIHVRDALAAGDAARRFIRLAVERNGGE